MLFKCTEQARKENNGLIYNSLNLHWVEVNSPSLSLIYCYYPHLHAVYQSLITKFKQYEKPLMHVQTIHQYTLLHGLCWCDSVIY